MGELPSCLLDLEETIDTHWYDGNPQSIGQDTDARSKWKQVAGCCVASLGKDEDVVATVSRFCCILEALLEPSLSRQRKYVQKSRAQCPFDAVVHFLEKWAINGRRPQQLHSFATSGCRYAMAKAPGQSCHHESQVHVADVIANHEHGTSHVAQIIAAIDPRPTQKKHRWTYEQIMRNQANPGNGPAQCPTRVVVDNPLSTLLPQHPFEIGYGSCS